MSEQTSSVTAEPMAEQSISAAKVIEQKSSEREVVFGSSIDETLAIKVSEFNSKAPNDRKTSLEMLKVVYRRGAGAAMTASVRADFAIKRVDAFLSLLKSGKASNSAYTEDNDLLPASHPKSINQSLTASAFEDMYKKELTVSLDSKDSYTYPEDAIVAMAEFSGFGYEAEPALRASWLRAVRAGGDPFVRASMLAIHGKFSIDADLLPSSEKGSE